MTLPLLLIQLAQHPASGQLAQLKQVQFGPTAQLKQPAQLKQAIQQSTQPRTPPIKKALKKTAHPLAPIPGTPERLLIRSDDEALGRAIVRSANQHVIGSVELLPRGVSPPPRALRLLVRVETMDRLMLVLSRGSKLSVVRLLKISGRPGLFDLAETVALASAEMRARLDEQVRRSQPGPPREVAAVSLPPSLSPEAVPEEAEPPPPDLSAIAPPVTELKVPDQTPEPAEPAIKEPEPVTPPSRFTAPLPLKLPTEPSLPSAWPPGWRWRIGLGTSLAASGLLLGGLGIASLVLDGRCADEAVPCEYRFDGRTAGAVEIAVGGAALIAGVGLLGSVLHQRRLMQGRAMLVPKVSSRGVGLTLSLEF